jgi:hypothetical protein
LPTPLRFQCLHAACSLGQAVPGFIEPFWGSRLVVHWMKEQYDWPHVGGRDVCPMEAQIRAARAAVTVGLEVGGIIACK